MYIGGHEEGRALLSPGANFSVAAETISGKIHSRGVSITPDPLTEKQWALSVKWHSLHRVGSLASLHADAAAMSQPDSGVSTRLAASSDGSFTSTALTTVAQADAQVANLAQPDLDPGTSNVFDSGCAYSSGYPVWNGCYARHHIPQLDPGHNYSIDESQGLGHGTEAVALTYGNSQQNYGAAQPVQWSPNATVGAGSCHTVSAGVTGGGVTVGESWQACPSNIVPHLSATDFHATWNGWNYSGGVGEYNVDMDKASLSGSQFTFNTHWGYCFC